MKIAIVGTGISGLVAAYLLQREHDIVVFESNTYVGGHTHTVPVEWEGATYPVDTGFIVFNDWTYPHFLRLLQRLGVASQPSAMSFSVRCDATGLEYNGTSINALFAQRRNLFRPSFYRMIRDVLRFNRIAPGLLARVDVQTTLGGYLHAGRYSEEFIRHYLIPMGAAIWSASTDDVRAMPIRFFVQFFHNHGMLSVDQRPVWRVVRGGSYRYVEALTAGFRDRIRTQTPVRSIGRTATGVMVTSDERLPDGQVQRRVERFDHVILAVHSDQALELLEQPTPVERDILGAIPYQHNEAVLHTDTALLPRRRLAWASWNYHLSACPTDPVAVTYHMNQLQGLQAPAEFCVTLNRTHAIDPAKVLRRIGYHHPRFTAAAVEAQARHGEISGRHRTSYCGAYWTYGFHEDGVNSGLAVCRALGTEWPS